ncbi:MAG TPA: N-6 DNA methylase [Daejeonella sp.]|uniref:N-6 DNA methylase n=1 Tax=Daejeonella sp. TaxID=2805397 RepID=UPI002ED9F623
MDLLGRYYTNDIVSTLLINSLDTIIATSVLDLGIGNASLTKAAYERWNDAIFYATEIEENKVKHIEENLSFVRISQHNSLKSNVKQRLKINMGSIDVAVCNPPYLKIEKCSNYKKLFKDANIEECYKIRELTSEIIFFAHNMTFLKAKGELGIIVSDSLITGKEYRIFRETILTNFDIKTVIQLPDKIFPNTEARTHIIVLSKSTSDRKTCRLLLADFKGEYEKCLVVQKSKLVERMDFQFWEYQLIEKQNEVTLEALGGRVYRGRFSAIELRKGRHPYFHSTSFKNYSKYCEFPEKMPEEYSTFTAKKGDILMCRVGKRCVGKLAMVTSGEILISDCIYRISVPEHYRLKVWEALNSDLGKAWIDAYAHGVCARVVSKCDLMNFPIAKLWK